MKTITIGNTVRFTGTVASRLTRSRIDPGTVAFKVRSPSGTVTTYTYGSNSEVTKIGTGIYACDLDLATAGVWTWVFECSGSAKGLITGSVTMVASGF